MIYFNSLGHWEADYICKGNVILFFVDSLLIVYTPVVGFCNIVLCFVVRYFIAFILMSFWCLVIVVWPFLSVPWVYLHFEMVVFPAYTHCYRYYFAISKKV